MTAMKEKPLRVNEGLLRKFEKCAIRCNIIKTQMTPHLKGGGHYYAFSIFGCPCYSIILESI